MTLLALAADSVTVKVAFTAPVFPSVTVTSLMVTSGLQSPIGELVLRGFGVATKKSAALSLVSTQPPALRKAAVVFDGAGAGLALHSNGPWWWRCCHSRQGQRWRRCSD